MKNIMEVSKRRYVLRSGEDKEASDGGGVTKRATLEEHKAMQWWR